MSARRHYLNHHVRDFQRWYVQNEPRLSEYWSALVAAGTRSGSERPNDFFDFAALEHEREQERVGLQLSQLEPLVAV